MHTFIISLEGRIKRELCRVLLGSELPMLMVPAVADEEEQP